MDLLENLFDIIEVGGRIGWLVGLVLTIHLLLRENIHRRLFANMSKTEKVIRFIAYLYGGAILGFLAGLVLPFALLAIVFLAVMLYCGFLLLKFLASNQDPTKPNIIEVKAVEINGELPRFGASPPPKSTPLKDLKTPPNALTQIIIGYAVFAFFIVAMAIGLADKMNK